MQERIYAYLNPNRHSQYNRRQRKKHRIAEFQELGVELVIQLVPSADESAMSALISDLSDTILTQEGWDFSGGFYEPPELTLYIMGADRESINMAGCEKLVAWAKARTEVQSVSGEVIDAWYHFPVDVPSAERA